MDYRQQKQAAKQFADNWAGRGYEKGETHQFWMDILQDICGMKHVSSRAKFEVHTSTGGFIDCLIPESGVTCLSSMVKSLMSRIGDVEIDAPEFPYCGGSPITSVPLNAAPKNIICAAIAGITKASVECAGS